MSAMVQPVQARPSGGRVLSPQQVRHYREHGYLFPVDCLSVDEAGRARLALESVEAANGGLLPKQWSHKPHLVFSWLDRLVCHPRILDVVEDIMGPDILCWSSRFFIKRERDGGFVSWHQDLPYWGLELSENILTVWVALSPATRANGVMKVLPGSHRALVRHREAQANNLLRRGQEVAVDVDEDAAVAMELAPGQASLHHGLTFHASDESRSPEPRIGFAIRYLPPHVRTLEGLPRDTATLVRGSDRFGHFEHLPRPRFDLDPDCIEAQKRAAAISDRIRDLAAGYHESMVAQAAARG